MNRRFRFAQIVALPVLVLVLLAGTATADRPYTERFDETFPLNATGRVSLDNINGDVVVQVWDRDEVRVEALKSADSQELLDSLKIEVRSADSSVDINTKYSKSGWGSRQSGHREVEYVLTVPRRASLDEVDLVNGDLEVQDVEGAIHAESVNGTLTVQQVLSDLELSTVNGSIEAYCDRIFGDRRLEIESVNGRIDLYLASGADAHVTAKTVNGKIGNDVGLHVERGKYVGSSMDGRLGSGEARIAMSTVNGGIRVHSR